MKVFTTVFFLAAFLVLIGMPEESFALPKKPHPLYGHEEPSFDHKEFSTCGPAESCEDSCQRLDASEGPCSSMNIDPKDCNQGYFCVKGYIRKYPGGPCILPDACPVGPSNYRRH